MECNGEFGCVCLVTSVVWLRGQHEVLVGQPLWSTPDLNTHMSDPSGWIAVELSTMPTLLSYNES